LRDQRTRSIIGKIALHRRHECAVALLAPVPGLELFPEYEVTCGIQRLRRVEYMSLANCG
jgi:hypothetical protein